MNKFLLVVIAIILVFAFIGSFSPDGRSMISDTDRLLLIAQDIGIIMMLINGTFWGSRHFKIARVVIVVVLLGMTMKIMHYTGADEVLVISLSLLWALYFIHFLSKKSKSVLDYLKVIMLLLFISLGILSALHLISWETKYFMGIANIIVFWTTFIVFLTLGYRAKTLFKS